ncbi:hypothetical protein CHS0354_012761 [Potamilus streckersoni]|uniref:Uncharacterized protein n=1 Tax=Potamilus streckersoni TaxID=2493646 RepID=A0AAE0RVD4_9BIVA|nr:hypothetical protein CHS0354_012761 [Potamilus streckersoni]
MCKELAKLLLYIELHEIVIGVGRTLRENVSLQECHGPDLKRSFPDVNYALLGYNILRVTRGRSGMIPDLHTQYSVPTIVITIILPIVSTVFPKV